MILRDFSSAIYLQIGEIQLSELVKRTFDEPLVKSIQSTLKELILEEFSLAPPTFHVHNGDRQDYENNIGFFRQLRHIPLLKELQEEVDYRLLVPWIRNPQGQEPFFRTLQNRHPQLFSFFDYERTKKELTDVLMAAIERKYRTDAINYHIKDRVGIEDRLLGVFDWQQNGRQEWFERLKGFMPELTLSGFQKVTLTEIVPEGLADDDAFYGGKTIKFGCFNDLNSEFMLSQHDALGTYITTLPSDVLAGLRNLFLNMLVARRYVFPEAIDFIIESQEGEAGEKYDALKGIPDFRAYAFMNFYKASRLLYDKIYLAHNLRSLD